MQRVNVSGSHRQHTFTLSHMGGQTKLIALVFGLDLVLVFHAARLACSRDRRVRALRRDVFLCYLIGASIYYGDAVRLHDVEILHTFPLGSMRWLSLKFGMAHAAMDPSQHHK